MMILLKRLWKVCLATLGLSRVYCEKKHFHGSAFAKLDLNKFGKACWVEVEKECGKMDKDAAGLQDISVKRQLMAIPQDKEKTTSS